MNHRLSLSPLQVRRSSSNFTRVLNLYPDSLLGSVRHVFVGGRSQLTLSPFTITHDKQILYVRDSRDGRTDKMKTKKWPKPTIFQLRKPVIVL